MLGVVHNYGEAARRNFGQLIDAEKSLQKQDPPSIMEFAKRDRRVELEQCEPVGVGQRWKHSQQAVSVRIGLHHGEYLRLICALARDDQIGTQCSKINLGQYWTGHEA